MIFPRLARAWRRAAMIEWLVLTLALAVLAGALGEIRGLGRADLTLYDAAMVRLGRAAPDDIVVIAIDEDSLRRIGRWPWRRAVHATLLDRLAAANVRAIAIDLILSEPDTRDPAGDQALARALAAHPRIVLPVLMDVRPGMAPQPLLPAPQFVASGVRLGHVNVETDSDGLVRSLFLEEGVNGKTWEAFMPALAREELAAGELPGARRPPGARSVDAWLRDRWMHIAFSGGPGHVRRVSYASVLVGEVPLEQFAGKYVLIGATAAGLGDAYPTPVTGLGRLMPGIEIHAHVLDTMLRGRAIEPASAAANAAYSILPLLAVMIGFLLLSPRIALAFNLAMLAAVMFMSFALLAWARLWFPPCAALLALLLAYPLWSWRKLEATLRFLGEEFERLRSEPAVVPESARSRRRSSRGDLLEQRIGAVRMAAESLRHTRRFFADSLEHLPAAVLVTGLDERVLIANRRAADCFGLPLPADLCGRRAPEIVAAMATDGAHIWGEARDALAIGKPGEGVERELRSDAGASYLLHIGLCFDAAGESVGYLAILADITPIREAERKREEVLAFLSHDLRSPQASILAAIDLNRLKPAAYPAEAILPQIAAHAQRTVDLAEQFVQLTRAESSDYRIEPCDLVDIGREAVEEVRPQAASRSVVLTLDLPATAPIRADRALLARVLVNLLNNAVKYSPEQTEVRLSVSSEGTALRCAVRDQGYGISEPDLARLFERFARFSNPGQPRVQGIGLGLAFVKAVIERHGSRLEVFSEVGKGSEFAFSLERA